MPPPQQENASLREQISELVKELETAREKLNTLEQAWEHSAAVGKPTAKDVREGPNGRFYRFHRTPLPIIASRLGGHVDNSVLEKYFNVFYILL